MHYSDFRFDSEAEAYADKIFKVVAKNNSAENKYMQSVKLNGMPYDKYYIDFKDIAAGGILEFEMGNTPS